MHDDGPAPAVDPVQRWPLHRRLEVAGGAILAAGLVAAVLIYLLAGPDPLPADDNSRLDDDHLARLGGQAAVCASRLHHWLGSLWQGRTLAYTVGTLAVVVTGLCFWIAGLAAVPLHDERRREP